MNNLVYNLVYLHLLSPLHTGAASQEGNVVGIAREVHTNFPYLPSSTIRGRLRAEVDYDATDKDASIKARIRRIRLFGPDLKDIQDKDFVEEYQTIILEPKTDSEKQLIKNQLTNLEQGSIWIGNVSLLWIPISSISHGLIWISCPLLIQRWSRLRFGNQIDVPELSSNLSKKGTIYLKDATIPANRLQDFPKGKTWQEFVPNVQETSINQVLVVPNRYCETLIEMSLWRQVKIKLNEHKVVTDGSFRSEEAIPPDTLMYFPWGVTTQTKADKLPYAKDFKDLEKDYAEDFKDLLKSRPIFQLGGQESLGRGFVQQLI